MLLAGIVLLYFLGRRVLGGMKHTVQTMIGAEHATNPTVPADLAALAAFSVQMLIGSVAPLILAIMAVGLLATVGQVGFVVTTKPLVPSLGKLSPWRGLKNMVNARAGVRLLMSLLKVALILVLTGFVIVYDLPAILRLGELEPIQAFAGACQLIYALALKLAALLLVLALIDFAFQKWNHLRDLRMTKKEVKDEMKQMDGDPLIKQRRASVARQLALQRIAQNVPRADVVVTNPTHYSVALKYQPPTMRAPKVIAKGADLLALRIRQIAADYAIPIVERKPLAQALYRSVEVGQEIPPEQYAAVAEILAYVYRLAGRKSA